MEKAENISTSGVNIYRKFLVTSNLSFELWVYTYYYHKKIEDRPLSSRVKIMQDNNEYDPRKAPMLLKISKALIERRGDDFVDAVIDYIITEKVYISESAVKKFVLAVKLSVI